jgi:hypothetical protein
MKLRLKSLLLLAALCLASGSSTALAASNYTIPFSSAYSFIGDIGGEIWLGTSYDGTPGSCTWKRLSNDGPSDYGLTDNWNINGSSGFDLIEILASSSLSWCGYTMYGILPYHTINLFGQGGTDYLVGGWSSSAVNGMSGTDDLNCRRSNCIVDGGSSGDLFYQSQHSSVTINASTADDRACVRNSAGTGPGTILSLNGGSNSTANPGDRRCGTGTSATTGWETVDCAWCGL